LVGKIEIRDPMKIALNNKPPSIAAFTERVGLYFYSLFFSGSS